ncbi:MAG: inverse autotransporter beta domain-containing protein [Rhabdochlamydiaceae bacterium]
MSKFYFLPISLILLNPGLADNLDTQRKLVGHAENASVAGAAVGKNPQLLKENLIKIPKITERSTSKNTALKEPSSMEKKSAQLKEVVPNPLQSKKVESQPKGKQPPYFPIEDSSPSIVENTPTEKAPEEVKPKKEPAQPKGKKQIVKQQEVTPEATRVAPKEQQKEPAQLKQEKQIVKQEEVTPVAPQEQPSNLSQQSTAPTEQKNYPMIHSPDLCRSPFHMMHVGLRHTEARGVGYHSGYTTLEGFGIYDRTTTCMPFVDIRGHVFDDGKFAGNIGVGGRTLLSSINHLLGYYFYYDVRQDHHDLTAQQVSPGIELLGKRFEYRMNGYFPVGDQKSHKYGFKFDEFHGHNILIKAKQRHVMIGGDAEVGAHITQSTKYDLYAGAGPYYFSSPHASAWGGKVRLLGRFKEYVSLEATYSYDHLFKNIIQGSVAVNLPFGRKLKRKGKDCPQQNDLLLSRAAFAPYRFEIPVIKKVSRKEKAINPATGDPWMVWFVNNTSSSNGTFESPFPTLLGAQNASSPNDMIYVFAGDGTSTGMNQGITLQNGQVLFGSGISHDIPTTKGKIKIPAFTSNFPQITNTAGNVVTLANGNEVSGMDITVTVTGARGINGLTNAPINGAIIKNNNIIGSVDYRGISIVGQGIVTIKNNQLINLSNPSASTFFGININSEDATFMKANISNNIIYGFQDGISFSPVVNPTTATTDATFANNFISNFGRNGIIYSTGMSNSIVNITGNTVLNTVGVASGPNAIGGIIVTLNNNPFGAGSVLIQNNTVVTTTSNATISILGEIDAGGPIPGSSLNLDIVNNQVTTGSAAGSVGIDVRTTTGSATICASITDNTVTQQTAGTNSFQITTNVPVATTAIINIDEFSGNIGPNVAVSGNVNFVPPGTCDE